MSDKCFITDKNNCCGCGACKNICPVNAITMQSDKEGFAYPIVDDKKCLHCGLCEKVCRFNKNIDKNDNFSQTYYLAKHTDLNKRMHSRSGGFFVAASDVVLGMKGCVFGCVLDSNMNVKHIIADDENGRNRMCGSKYVQSETANVFNEVEENLINNKWVMFSGTACQVDGLKSYLLMKNVSTQNLVTMDIVCHGVCSPLLFKDYIDYQKKIYNDNITAFDFRNKTKFGWESHIETFTINGKIKSSSLWTKIFHSDMSIRPSCYNCKYASLNRPADITLADAWGVGKKMPSFHDNRGVSLVLVNTEKGQEIFEKAKKDCTIVSVDIKDYMQTNLVKPSSPRGDRDVFWHTYYDGGFEALVKKYTKKSIKSNAKNKIKRIVRKVLKGRNFYLPL